MRRLYGDTKKERDRHLGPGPADRSGIFEPEEGGKKLVELQTGAVLTLQGELDKLAANISIGRDMAGVHYYTDYYESLRMGERVAVGLLREQMLTYPEAVSMRFISFDGLRVTIAGDGNGRSATVKLQDSDGAAVDYDTWFAGY